MERMLNACLLREELAQRPIEISEAELQHGLDGWRRAHRLYTSEDTLHWMQQRGLTQERLEDLVIESLAFIKLRERVVEGDVAPYFERHRAELGAASLNAATCHLIKEALLDAWLEERRRTARVSWYWGTADRTEK
jgi:hypothetical protein